MSRHGSLLWRADRFAACSNRAGPEAGTAYQSPLPSRLRPRTRRVAETTQSALLIVPSESVEGDDYIVPDACFAGQPTVSFKPGEIGRGCRSHRQTGTMMIALWVDLWKSSQASARVSRIPASTRQVILLLAQEGGRLVKSLDDAVEDRPQREPSPWRRAFVQCLRKQQSSV